jgi:Rho-binding antiterminator
VLRSSLWEIGWRNLRQLVLPGYPAKLCFASSTLCHTMDLFPYRPIDCDLHDALEAAAIRREMLRVRFLDVNGEYQQCHTRIVDVFSRNGAEYLSLETGETVRLDRLVAVGDTKFTA